MMKKSSKVISMVLAVVMAMSCFMGISLFNASAADDTKIYFKLPEELWGLSNTEKGMKVYCHMWSVAGDSEFVSASWQTTPERCSYDKETGLWSYDPQEKLGCSMKEGADYGIIFSAKNKTGTVAEQTFNTTAGVSCYGDTAYVVDKKYENPEDSSQLAWGAFWTSDANKNVYGPQMAITSKGNLTGEFWAPHQDPADAIANFIKGQSANIEKRIAEENYYCCVELCKELNTTEEAVMASYERIYAAELAENPPTVPTLAQIAPYFDAPVIPVEPTNATTAPVEPTDAPTTPVEPTDAPTTPVEPTDVPVVEDTTAAPAEEETTVAPDATSATEADAKGNATPDTTVNGNNNGTTNTNGAVQTGSASMALIALFALMSATVVAYLTRKKIR